MIDSPALQASPVVAARPKPAGGIAPRAREFLLGYLAGLFGGGAALAALGLATQLLFPPPRTNILLLGVDRRPETTTYVCRTDTMILATIYPARNYVGLLSIPRDLYVPIPTGVVSRINTAHFWAEAAAGPVPGAAASAQKWAVLMRLHPARGRRPPWKPSAPTLACR